MVRVAGVNIPDEKAVAVGLSYIYGIGLPLGKKIVAQAKIDQKKKVKDLSSEELNALKQIIEKNYKVEGDLEKGSNNEYKKIKRYFFLEGNETCQGFAGKRANHQNK